MKPSTEGYDFAGMERMLTNTEQANQSTSEQTILDTIKKENMLCGTGLLPFILVAFHFSCSAKRFFW
jgi:hypothetical protein